MITHEQIQRFKQANPGVCVSMITDRDELDWSEFVYKLLSVEVLEGVRWPEAFCYEDGWVESLTGNDRLLTYRCPVADWCDECGRPKGSCACIKERARKVSEQLKEMSTELPGPLVDCEWCGEPRNPDRDETCDQCGGSERVKRYKLERDSNGTMVCMGHHAPDAACLTDIEGRVFSHWAHENGNIWSEAVPLGLRSCGAVWPHAAVFVMPEEGE